MSILGANADDMEEILKGLGYRSDARPAAAVKARIAEIDEATQGLPQRLPPRKPRPRRQRHCRPKRLRSSMSRRSPVPIFPPLPSKRATAEEPATATMQRTRNRSKHERTAEHADASCCRTGRRKPGRACRSACAAGRHCRRRRGCARRGCRLGQRARAKRPGWRLRDTALQPADSECRRRRARHRADEPPSRDAQRTCTRPLLKQALAEAPAEEPKPILIWRPARFDQRPRHRHEGRPRDGAARPGEARKPGRSPGEARRRMRQGHRAKATARRGHRASNASSASSAASLAAVATANSETARMPAPARAAPMAGRTAARRAIAAADATAKSWTTQKPREDRPVRVDPDSPFAKLAALRDQLKK